MPAILAAVSPDALAAADPALTVSSAHPVLASRPKFRRLQESAAWQDEAARGATLEELVVARGIGRDHAAFGLRPPAALMLAHPALRRGWEAGRNAFHGRERTATPHARAWLDLRLRAWLDGQHVELASVTPRLLAEIATAHCPVTRVALGGCDSVAATGRPARLRSDAAWAAGHLACLSTEAARALPAMAWTECVGGQPRTEDLSPQDRPTVGAGRLQPAERLRLATLQSFVTHLPHAVAVRIPLRVLPPNRVRMLNPAQALQALVTLQLLRSGWSQRLAALEALLPPGPSRPQFKALLMRLVSLALGVARPGAGQAWRHALEAAWSDPVLQGLWTAWALPLGAVGCRHMAQAIASQKLLPCAAVLHDDASVTDGWFSGSTAGHALVSYASASRAVAARQTHESRPESPAQALSGHGHAAGMQQGLF